ncbi:MAG: hypothetical protein DRG33_00375 [Deltaproteobacteria bacterium]|nr:MAG: hypothetical protein DRG33_00375 [Deltaproteobacteria bacterium]HEX15730.1 hypothetical protein [Deltaproteobacteria bacterium]
MARKRGAKKAIPPCPLAALMFKARELRERHSPFWEHLTRARIELLEAFKSLIDERIEKLRTEGKEGELTKIEVE